MSSEFSSDVPSYTRRQVMAAGAGTAALLALGHRAIGELVSTVDARKLSVQPHPFTTHGPAPSTSLPMHTTKVLKVETVTQESFAPFGDVLSDTGRKRLPINTYGDSADIYREDLASDQPLEWFIVQFRKRWPGVLFVERHQQLTQSFIPLGGLPFITVVAPPGCSEVDGFPAVEHLRAFLVPGDVAIQLHRGTWHENPMAAGERARLLVTTHARLTLAHQQNPDPKLKDLPLDLERRWYKAGGYELTVTQ